MQYFFLKTVNFSRLHCQFLWDKWMWTREFISRLLALWVEMSKKLGGFPNKFKNFLEFDFEKKMFFVQKFKNKFWPIVLSACYFLSNAYSENTQRAAKILLSFYILLYSVLLFIDFGFSVRATAAFLAIFWCLFKVPRYSRGKNE